MTESIGNYGIVDLKTLGSKVAPGTVVNLGYRIKDTGTTNRDFTHQTTYQPGSRITFEGHYGPENDSFKLDTFTLDHPDQAALKRGIHSLNSAAVAKLLVALAGVLPPEGA